MKDEIVYSAQEVADILKIKKSTIYNMIKRGDIVAYWVGNKVRISDREVENYKKRATSNPLQHEIEIYDNKQKEIPLLDEPIQRPGGFIICGQDTALDTLANQMQNLTDGKVNPLRSYVGSYNGLYMLYQEQVSIATAHLWDGRSNTYNVPYIERMLPGVSAVIIHMFKRMQGFYVQKGNPKNIQSWDDLKRSDITIVNREKGSGTRVLLDEKLRIAGISSSRVAGYRRECVSHLAVAGVVARGGADLGVGTRSASKLIAELDFIPLQQENYDLVIKKDDINKPMHKAVLEILRSDEYKIALEGMKEYDLTGLGNIIAET